MTQVAAPSREGFLPLRLGFNLLRIEEALLCTDPLGIISTQWSSRLGSTRDFCALSGLIKCYDICDLGVEEHSVMICATVK